MTLVSVVAQVLSPASEPQHVMPQEIPAVYVSMYREAERVFGVNRFLLASIHAQESDFGRSRARGVHAGLNAAGCCAGPMQFNLTDTWAGVADAYQRGQRPATGYPDRAASHPSPYDPFDAIMAAGLKLQRQGATLDLATAQTRQAVLAYNHADWYADQVIARAIGWQHDADRVALDRPSDGAHQAPFSAPWLATVPGFPNQRCDRRILTDLQALIQAYHVAVVSCFALSGHKRVGDHPLGLGVDLVPARGGTWSDLDRLARWAEPQPDAPRVPFRWVGYDGDVGHGRGHHLHLSWKHAPAAFGTPAQWVLVLADPAANGR